MTETEVAASLTAFGYTPRPATALVIEQSPPERFVRTLAGLGMFWGFALVSLFIPVAHLVLVPTFLVGGIIMAVKRAREDRRLLLLRGACPRCGATQSSRRAAASPAGAVSTARSATAPSPWWLTRPAV